MAESPRSRSLHLAARVAPAPLPIAVAIAVNLLVPGAALLRAQDFQVQSFGKTGCTLLEHEPVTGRSHGGIALSSSQAFYSGSFATGRFDLDLTEGTALVLGRPYDGLVSDLATGTVYSLAEGTVPLRLFSGRVKTIDTLLEFDGETGDLTGDSIVLSSSFELASFATGVFSGYGRIVLWDRRPPGALYDVDLPSGVVTALPGVATPDDPYSPWPCYMGPSWGVAESLAGALSLVYATGSDSIARLDVATGVATTVRQFSDLSSLCSLTVDPGADRWYFHFRNTSQFGGVRETIAFCSAQVATSGSADLAASNAGGDLQVPVGGALSFITQVANSGPDDATGVALAFDVPGILDLTAVTPSMGSCHQDACANTVVCDFGTLSSGSTATVELEVSAVIEGFAQVPFIASAEELDLDLANNSGARNVSVLAAGNRRVLALDDHEWINEVDLVTRTADLTGVVGSVPVELPGEALYGGHGLAADPATGELWALLQTTELAYDGRVLAAIEPRSGIATAIGQPGEYFSALAVDASGTLYGLTDQSASTPSALFELDRATAASTFVTDLANPGLGEALAAGTGSPPLYHLGGSSFFESVDPAGPVPTPIPLCRPLPGYSMHAATHFGDNRLLTASAAGAGRLDPDGSFHQTSLVPLDSNGLALVDPPQADLSVVLSDSADPVAEGDTFTYFALIANGGPAAIADLGFADELPGEVTALSATPSQGSCSMTCGVVYCELGSLASGQSATVDIEARAVRHGLVTNTVVYSPYGDPNPSDNVAAETTTVTEILPPGTEPDLLYSLDTYFHQVRRLSPDFATLDSVPITLAGATILLANGMAIDPTTGQVWALLFLEDQEGRELVKLHPATGVATRVGNTGDYFAALAFDADGVLYGLTGNEGDFQRQLFTLDLTNGAPTPFLDLSAMLPSYRGVSLAYHPGDGMLYAAAPHGVVAVDLSGPTATLVGPCRTFMEFASAATSLDATGLLVADRVNRLFRFDLDTAAGTFLGYTDHTSKGLVFRSSLIFADGFESGDTASWSTTSPPSQVNW